MTRAILTAAVLAGASWAAADEVWLKGGGRIVGEVVERHPDSVVLEVGPGTVKLPMSRVDRIVGTSSGLAEFRSRAGRLAATDLDGWVALATWAEQHDLRTQARDAWHRVLAIQPHNGMAQQALGNVMYGGRWMDRADAMRAQGLVEFEGQWISPSEREARIRMDAAAAAAQRENAVADARVAEAEARAREAEARARAAEADAERADEYSDDGGIPIGYGGIGYGGIGYGGIGYGGSGYGGVVVGPGVQPCCGRGSPDNPRHPHSPPVTQPPQQRDRNPQPTVKPNTRAVGEKPRG